MNGWVRFCERLTLSYASRVGSESLRAFVRRRVEDNAAYIVAEYEETVRESGVHLEDRKPGPPFLTV